MDGSYYMKEVNKETRWCSRLSLIKYCLDRAQLPVLVLIDRVPALRRNVEIMRVKDKAEYIVIHDTECGAYDYIKTTPTFKYKLLDERFGWPQQQLLVI